ncbi:GNAT family protein [Gymnodinialimonas sp. 2305UL16-5]|uniref:GNAT family N-acetyltransferase n=1 Tax=Gymnodinialimonas mytili TaxID=3126503 RepID=UPI0030B2D441
MNDSFQFRTTRLSGRPPRPMALGIYERLFGSKAEGDLDRDIQDWGRHRIAPWTLVHAGHEVGVGGFRIGFGDDGLEVLFHFVPEVWGQGLAGEFLTSALDHARQTLREDRFFGRVADVAGASHRVMQKAGFHDTGPDESGGRLMRLK